MSQPGQPDDFFRKSPPPDQPSPTPASFTDPGAAPPPGFAPEAASPYGAPAPYGSPSTPPPGYVPQPPAYAAPMGGYPGAPDAGAPFGRDPRTGEPMSDKSKVAAGLLQIFLGGYGVGRFYIGDNKTAGIMLGLTILGWVLSIVIVGIFIVIGVGIWALVDGIMMLTGSVKDSQGRPLRS